MLFVSEHYCRNTMDIDILVHENDFEQAVQVSSILYSCSTVYKKHFLSICEYFIFLLMLNLIK